MLTIEEINLLVAQNEGLKKQNEELQQAAKEEEKYKEAIEKIEKICKKSSNEWEAYKDETCTFHCKTRKTDRAKLADKVLNIISKAKDGE